MDEIVVFHPLGKEHLAQIVTIQLQHVAKLLADRGYALDVTPEAAAYLAEAGYDPNYGARPLKRAIQRELQDPLALALLSGEIPVGSRVRVDVGSDGLVFKAG